MNIYTRYLAILMSIVVTSISMSCTKSSTSSQIDKQSIIRSSTAYWEQCRGINSELAKQYKETWFKEYRPNVISAMYADAATKLRELETTGVDPTVIDHVSMVSRAYDNIGTIVQTHSKADLWRLAGNALLYVAQSSSVGVVNPAGPSPIVGPFGNTEAESKIAPIDQSIKDSEIQVITTFRNQFGTELKPW